MGAPAAPRARLTGALLAALASGCPRPPASSGAARPADAPRLALAPLAARAWASDPHHAIVLGTDERDGSTRIALAGARVALALAAPHGGGGAEPGAGAAPAGLAALSLEAAPRVAGAAPGPGSALAPEPAPAPLRAALWAAALEAASALGRDVVALELRAVAAALVDESVAALAAGGFLAALTAPAATGAPSAGAPDRAATAVGALDPDGAVGPVAALPELVAAAIAGGKRRIGYPAGQRIARTRAGELVDVARLARAAGAEAVALGTAADAHRLLTGRPLPEPMPAAAADLALDGAATARVVAQHRAWQRRLAAEWAATLQLEHGSGVPPQLLALARRALRLGEAAEALAARGAPAAAAARARDAWVAAVAATGAADVVERARGSARAARDRLAAIDPLAELDGALAELLADLRARAPRTLGGHLQLAGAVAAALRAHRARTAAAAQLGAAHALLVPSAPPPAPPLAPVPPPAPAAAAADALAEPAAAAALAARAVSALLAVARGLAEVADATVHLDAVAPRDPDYVVTGPGVDELAAALAAAAGAATAAVEVALVAPVAPARGGAADEAWAALADAEPEELLALAPPAAVAAVVHALRGPAGEPTIAARLAPLVAAGSAYDEAAARLSLARARAAGAGAAAADPLLASLLERADRAARAHARAARVAAGAIPVAARVAYQRAIALRSGDAASRVEALAALWAASAASRLAATLARHGAPATARAPAPPPPPGP
jgi:hypothetical protein